MDAPWRSPLWIGLVRLVPFRSGPFRWRIRTCIPLLVIGLSPRAHPASASSVHGKHVCGDDLQAFVCSGRTPLRGPVPANLEVLGKMDHSCLLVSWFQPPRSFLALYDLIYWWLWMDRKFAKKISKKKFFKLFFEIFFSNFFFEIFFSENCLVVTLSGTHS